jgi:cytochrome c oxidase subunit 1
VKIFNWIGTLWGGSLKFTTAMLFAIGFVAMFTIGGLSGVTHAVSPHDRQQTDTYYVVAHFHYVLFGGALFGIMGGIYYWWPKVFGVMLDERLGKLHFWLLFIGFHTTFLVQHWLGVEGMPRRYADYLPDEGFTVLNQVSSAGAFLLGASMIPFFINLRKSRKSPLVNTDDPWGWGRSLEWATSCPPPRHNFTAIPRIRSESPAFDLHHPEVALLEYEDEEEEEFFEETAVDAGEDTGRRGELRARVRGTTTDLAAQYEATHHSRSPDVEEDQR